MSDLSIKVHPYEIFSQYVFKSTGLQRNNKWGFNCYMEVSEDLTENVLMITGVM
jgi:hypothetical protein